MGEGKKGMAKKKREKHAQLGIQLLPFHWKQKKVKINIKTVTFHWKERKKGRKKRIYGKKE